MGNYSTIISLVLMFAIFYFLLIRPQQKRQKQRNAMLNALKKGDKIVTIGGMHGQVVELTEDAATVKVADNVRLVFERSAINTVVSTNEKE